MLQRIEYDVSRCLKPKFFSLLVVLQLILMPVATKDFRFEAAGDIKMS